MPQILLDRTSVEAIARQYHLIFNRLEEGAVHVYLQGRITIDEAAAAVSAMATQVRLKVITDFNGYEFSATPGDTPQQDETPAQVLAKYNVLLASPAVREQQAQAEEAMRLAALERNEAAEKAVIALIGTESRSKEELFAALAKIKSALGSEDIDFFVMTSLRHPAEIEMFTQEYLNRTGAIGLKNLRLVACSNETLMGTKRFWLEAADKYEQSLSSAS